MRRLAGATLSGAVAGGAAHAGHAEIVGAADDQRLVRMHRLALQRPVARRDGSSRSADAG